MSYVVPMLRSDLSHGGKTSHSTKDFSWDPTAAVCSLGAVQVASGKSAYMCLLYWTAWSDVPKEQIGLPPGKEAVGYWVLAILTRNPLMVTVTTLWPCFLFLIRSSINYCLVQCEEHHPNPAMSSVALFKSHDPLTSEPTKLPTGAVDRAGHKTRLDTEV